MRNFLKGFALLTIISMVSLTSCNKENDLIDDGGGSGNTATCVDGIQNGDETGIDCGGSCTPCTVAATCDDGIQNGDETGIDCGGADCAPCETEPTCDDGIQNGDEAGVDCGGSCTPCEAEPTCNDGIQNGDETGIDCGGSCSPCEVDPTCDDGIQNGDETGVDCGGSCAPCTSATSMKDFISSTPKFSMLQEAIDRAGFDLHEGMGDYTFFAPNNDAWTTFLESNNWTSIDQVSPAVLNIVLEVQFSNQGAFTSDLFTNNYQIQIVYLNKIIHIDLSNPSVLKVIAGLTSCVVVGEDQMMTNGVIHETDAVLIF